MSALPLNVDISVSRGDFGLSVNHFFPPGSVTAIIGPNGAGKSTLLESIAGFLADVEGTIRLGETSLLDTTQNQATRLAPNQRGTVYLGQTPSLFPHLSVADNIGFGPSCQRLAKKDREREVAKWAGRLKLEPFLRRRPVELSSGQQQRVALARALAANPSVLLLDEPTTALDVDAAKAFRSTLKMELQSYPVTAILVSHTIEDVVGLADIVITLEDGRITSAGRTNRQLFMPQSAFAANFAGLNRLEGVSKDDAVTVEGVTFHTNNSDLSGKAAIAIRPTAISITPLDHASIESGAAPHLRPNEWVTNVVSIDAQHFGFAVTLETPRGLWGHVGLESFDSASITPGQQVQVHVPKSCVIGYFAQ